MKTIRFKSIPKNWIKEFNGIKNNTVRIFDTEDEREEILMDWLQTPFHLNIEIKNTTTKDVFTRIVKDITKYEKMYIITW